MSEFDSTFDPVRGSEPPSDPVRLRDGLTLGRETDNDVVLKDLLASRHHARVRRSEGGAYVVEDLGATNRTFVNGEPVAGKGTPLHDGEILTVGRTRFLRAGDRLYPLPSVKDGSLEVTDLTYTLPDGRSLVSGLSWRVHGPGLVAVIGPSGSGKSTLLDLLAGRLRPTSGEIRYNDTDVPNCTEIRGVIGSVPQRTVAHGHLRVGDALRYTAELRLPHDTSPTERAERLQDVLTELELTGDTATRVDRLSGGRGRQLSIAFELLTRPSLLLVDEPTTGLDPARVRHVMRLLRTLADGGRQVIFTTHDLTYLDLCDTVLALAPGGRVYFHGTPDDLGKLFGNTEWADVFERLERDTAPPVPPPSHRQATRRTRGPSLTNPVARRRATAQTGVIIRRQLRLLAARPLQIALSTALPIILALVAATGSPPTPVLALGIILIGVATLCRDLVSEKAIYPHERAAGLLPVSYLLAKVSVFAAITALQSLLLITLLALTR